MAKPHVKLYVDTVSPFGYLGYWMIRNSPVFKSCSVEYVPILLGGLMKQCNNTPPLTIKNKDKWINRERSVWSSLFKIPMREQTPKGFPVPTLTAQRLLTALHMHSPQHLPVALDTLYSAMWAPDTLPKSTPSPSTDSKPDYNLNALSDLKLLLSQPSVLGAELTEKLIEMAGSKEVKEKLGANTQAAFDDGAFGLPWFQCTNSKGEVMGFWGFDHLGVVGRFLGLEASAEGEGKLRPLL